MEESISNFHFRLMSFGFKFRDFFRPRRNILEEAGINTGFQVLDYGCGPGSYIVPLAKLVGKSGKIYALDVHPLAIKMVQSIAERKKLENIETILSDRKTALPDSSLDTILLYDVLHDLDNQNEVLEELYRVLKPDGILSSSDHHLKENEIISQVTTGGLFNLLRKGKWTFTFSKQEK